MAPIELGIPAGNTAVDVQIIDTTFYLHGAPLSMFTAPAINGFEKLFAGAMAFLITHKNAKTGKESKLIFDLGAPKDLENDLPLPVYQDLISHGIGVDVKKNVSEIIEENGIKLDSINAVVWSHPHWDHIGRPSLFPASTKLIVGPGLKSTYYPGYPEVPDAPILSREMKGREVEELAFDSPSTVTIGGFKAIDYFGDGSVFFLDAPGHAVGHINLLVRTSTTPDNTFMYLGADSFHHASQIRPNKYSRLPNELNLPKFNPCPCPGEIFHNVHPAKLTGGDPNSEPFSHIPEKSLAINAAQANDVISKIQAFDADENVFVVGCHDWSVVDILDFLPAKANDWKAKGWRERTRWNFLTDFQEAIDIAKL